MACLVLRPFLGFSAVIVAEEVMRSAFDFSRRAFPCAFALLMLYYDPRAATTVENPTRSALVLGSLMDSPVESFNSLRRLAALIVSLLIMPLPILISVL